MKKQRKKKTRMPKDMVMGIRRGGPQSSRKGKKGYNRKQVKKGGARWVLGLTSLWV
ncbi:hypothetical protein ACFLZ9_02160 [Patescibacteria group bacterium]